MILESGFGMKHESWQAVQNSVARFARVCSYDRADITSDVIGDLHLLLTASHITPPYILVGHSIGGIYVRAFTRRFPAEVAGLVFVDSSHEEQFWRQQQIAKQKASLAAHLAGFLAPGQALNWHFDIPLIVIERGRPEQSPELTAAQSKEYEALWHMLQMDLAGRTKYGKLVIAEHSGHMIPLDQPSIVVTAIRDVSIQPAEGVITGGSHSR